MKAIKNKIISLGYEIIDLELDRQWVAAHSAKLELESLKMMYPGLV